MKRFRDSGGLGRGGTRGNTEQGRVEATSLTQRLYGVASFGVASFSRRGCGADIRIV